MERKKHGLYIVELNCHPKVCTCCVALHDLKQLHYYTTHMIIILKQMIAISQNCSC